MPCANGDQSIQGRKCSGNCSDTKKTAAKICRNRSIIGASRRKKGQKVAIDPNSTPIAAAQHPISTTKRMEPGQLIGNVTKPSAWPALINTANTTRYTDT